MRINVQKLEPDCRVPEYANPGDAGADLRASHDVSIAPGSREVVRCGFAMEIPEGHCGLVIPRSGLALRHGITVLNAPGLIDSGYRGEIAVVLLNTDDERAYNIKKGDRIAQLAIFKVEIAEFVPSDDLSESERGGRGFGSSGVK